MSPKTKEVGVFNSIYSLFLFCLIYPDKIDKTLFIFGSAIDESIRKNFKHMIYINESRLAHKNIIIRYFAKLILRIKYTYKFAGKNLIFWGHDHLSFSPPVIGNHDINVIEDGVGNYNEYFLSKKDNVNFFHRIFSPILYGRLTIDGTYGGSKNTKKIILTGLKNIPEIIKNKAELYDIHKIWHSTSSDIKNKILDIFNLVPQDISLFEKKDIIILTQPYHNLIGSAELIEIYKKSISQYDPKDIVIKTHPRDTIDYSKVFNEITVFTKPVPIEILGLMGCKFKDAITINSSGICSIISEKKTILGWDAHPKFKQAYAKEFNISAIH